MKLLALICDFCKTDERLNLFFFGLDTNPLPVSSQQQLQEWSQRPSQLRRKADYMF